MKHGPLATVDASTGSALFPKIQDLATYEDLTISLHDRTEPDPTKSVIMEVNSVKPESFNTQVAARGLMSFSMSFVGLFYSDESGDMTESAGAAELPND